MNNTGRSLKCFLIMTLFASAAFGQAPLTVRDVITKMAGVYAQSVTYRDEGQVTINGSGRILSFITLFNRPASLYKFEFTSSGPQPPTFNHFVSWRTAPGDVRLWSTLTPQVELKPMNMALAPGLALTVGHAVPVLLMPEVGFVSFSLSSDWMDPVPPEEETVDGRACYKITGHYANGLDNTLSVWIDKQSFLIRKMVDKRQTITYYNPQVNISIDAALFDFQPPAANPSR